MSDWGIQADISEIDEEWVAWLLEHHAPCGGFTAIRSTGNAYNATVPDQCRSLYADLVNTSNRLSRGPPIYIISITDHHSTEVDEILKRGYKRAADLSDQPLLGYWISPDGPCLDASIAVQFIREEAIRLGEKHGQKAIFEINEDGAFQQIKVNQDSKHVPSEL
ncbi:MAG: hypothetical protein MPJ06_08275 [Nitrosopumilus sp.]|nr:hypothetical protein [Nitrosopumilus sp.]MDA7943976.1 hypothetical protein [Nitrosopumilus sp.]MDA7955344.1 hypothetical protein [Nitrosopumilus sp.]